MAAIASHDTMKKDKPKIVYRTDDGQGIITVRRLPSDLYTKLKQYCTRELVKQCSGECKVQVFGVEHNQPRNIAFFSNKSIGYGYSGRRVASNPVTPELGELMDWVNTEYEDGFNGVLVNEYVDGKHCIGAHSDDERELGVSGVVGIVFGAVRKFRIRDKITKKSTDLVMPCGTVYHMNHALNMQCTHAIPKELKIKNQRVSLTFRKHHK